MISESQQELAALHALGMLDADEAGAFERQTDADPDLGQLVRELREAAAMMALSSEEPPVAAPPALRERVLAEIQAHGAVAVAPVVSGDKVVAARIPWVPWAIAALLLGCSGVLLWNTERQKSRVTDLESALLHQQTIVQMQTAATQAASDTLAQVSFCALEPTPDFATAQPRAAVLWDAAHHRGKLRVNRLAPPAEGKDYQLWTVEAGRKDAVSAGVVHVDADGKADLPFQPVTADGKPVVAVAISLEQAGGSPTNRGPILLLGKF